MLRDILDSLNLSVSDAAAQLGVSRVAFSRLLNERAALSPEMALRIEAWLGVDHGGRADVWLSEQTRYDLWQARKGGIPGGVKPISHAVPA
jgi:addiction module HigA family antidote